MLIFDADRDELHRRHGMARDESIQETKKSLVLGDQREAGAVLRGH